MNNGKSGLFFKTDKSIKDDTGKYFYDPYVPPGQSVVKKTKTKQKTKMELEILNKAFCGDGLLRCILGELYFPLEFTRNQIGQMESNHNYAAIWRKFETKDPDGNAHNDATRYEAKVYDVFKKNGYKGAVRYVKETHGKHWATQSINGKKVFNDPI